MADARLGISPQEFILFIKTLIRIPFKETQQNLKTLL